MEFKIDNKQIEILKTVKDKTKEIYDYLSNNINTIYEKNQGNHKIKNKEENKEKIKTSNEENDKKETENKKSLKSEVIH